MGDRVTAERTWTTVVGALRWEPDVTVGTMFNSEGLRHRDKYFAMLCRGELVVKLTAARVDELEEAGVGCRFDPGHGRKMREWLAVPVVQERRWRRLAEDALEIARTRAAAGRV